MRSYLVSALAVLCVGAASCGERDIGARNVLESDAGGVGTSSERNVAMGHLYTVAVVHVGLVEISFSTDPATGARSTTYHGGNVPRGSDEERAAIIDPVVAKLILIADSDKSGKVTDTEAGNFRRLYEFAHRFRAAVDSQAGSANMIATACGISMSELQTSILEYNQLVVRAEEVGLEGLSKIQWDGQG